MGGFNSHDELVSEITASGKFWRSDFMKNIHNIGTVVAGRWYDLTSFQGNPTQSLHGNYILNYDFMSTSFPWTLGSANWAYTIATHLLTRTANADVSTVSQNTACIPGETYTVIFTMTRSAGGLTVSLGGTNGTQRTAAGTYREDIVCGTTANQPLVFTPDATFAGTIDLVWVGKSLEFTAYTSTEEHALYCGPTPSAGETKHIINVGAFNNAALGSPSVLLVVDLLGAYSCIKTNNNIIQNLTHETRLKNRKVIGNANYWTLGTDWAYGTNSIVRSQAANTTTLSQVGVNIKAGVPYTLKFTMSSTTASGGGSITPSLGGVNGTPRTGDGTYQEIITPTVENGDLVFTPTSDNIATTLTDFELYPMIPRYTDGVGVRAFASTNAGDTLPGANAQSMNLTYINTAGIPTKTTIDTCSVADWTDSADMTTTVNTTNFRSGAGALNLTKDGTAAALASTTKATTSANVVSRNTRVSFWYYCIDATAYAKLATANALRVRFGSDSSNYYSWDFSKAALIGNSLTGAGWQRIECNLMTPTGTTGTPELSAMDYTYIGITATTTGTTWSAGDFIIDNIYWETNGSQLGQTVANTASSIASHILHSGVAAGNCGPFLPLAAGDTGILRVDNVTFSAASAAAGAVSVVLCKPLFEIPLPVGFVMTERDLLNQLPSLPRLRDGACLGFLLYCGAVSVAGTQWLGYIDFAWS